MYFPGCLTTQVTERVTLPRRSEEKLFYHWIEDENRGNVSHPGSIGVGGKLGLGGIGLARREGYIRYLLSDDPLEGCWHVDIISVAFLPGVLCSKSCGGPLIPSYVWD